MIGHIYLVRNENKTVPAVIIEVADDRVLLAQIKNYVKNDKNLSTINIGHPSGLKNPSAVMLYRVFTVDSKNLIKKISELTIELTLKIRSDCREFNKKNTLHKKLQKLKGEILRAQFNNQDYKAKEKEVELILNELGYSTLNNKNKLFERPFLNYREVPTKGRIKIYLGGRN